MKSLNRKLRRIPDVMERRIDMARVKGANELVRVMKQVVPKGRTLRLMNSIRWKQQDTTTDDTKRGAVFVTAGDDIAWYARFVEFGTRPHFQPKWRGGFNHPGSRPSNFFFGSYRLYKKRLIGRIKREAGRGAREAARGR